MLRHIRSKRRGLQTPKVLLFPDQHCYSYYGCRRETGGLLYGSNHGMVSHRLSVQTRSLFTGISPFVLVPGLFVGLLLAHWVHKCLLMVLFQNKIVYMPSLPPGSRREKLESYSKAVAPVSWEETKIKSLDGTDLSLAVAQLRDLPRTNEINDERMLRVIVYFQGNGASLPPRTLMLSNVLRSVASKNSHDEWIMVGLSYRGYWTSSGHAHQKGIEKDAEAVMDWVLSSYLSPHRNVDLILWGQSIGSGVAAFAAARYTEKYCDDSANWKAPPISRLILETPFVSIKSMLAALYPDWWVPYRHLWPFLRSWWDSEEALRKIASTKQSPKILMVIASRDEIVPPIQADQLEQLCNDLQLDLQRRNVLGALHTQASSLEVGKNIIVEFLTSTNQR